MVDSRDVAEMSDLLPIVKERPPEGTHRVLLTVSYDGTAYAGWQWQDNALSVQKVLEEAQQEAEEAAAQEAAGHAPTKPKPKPKPTPKQKQRPSFRKRMARALRLGKEEQS